MTVIDSGQALNDMHGDRRLFDLASWFDAATLAERVAALHAAGAQSDPFDAALGARRLRRWRLSTSFLSDDEFRERLTGLGTDEAALSRLLGEPSEALRRREHCVPSWLEDLIQAWADHDRSASGLYDAIGDEAGGYELLAAVEPLVARAQRDVRGRARVIAAGLQPSPFDCDRVTAMLFAHMPAELFRIVSRTLMLELQVARLRGELHGDDSRARFLSFVARLRDPGYCGALFSEYPVLARLVVTRLQLWVAASTELLERLVADWASISHVFANAQPLGCVVRVESALGDSHRGGRSVTLLELDSGLKVVYKPRPLAAEYHFQALLTWVNAKGWSKPFRPVGIIDRGTYGWMEFVEQQPCASSGEAADFYHRQGGLLALLHLLHATDVHFQNVIAAGAQPMLIDLESLFTPKLPMAPEASSDPVGWAALACAVTRVGLLPERSWADERHAGIDVSGLGNPEGKLGVRAAPSIEHAGTDQMAWSRKRVPWERGKNVPTIGTEDVDVLAFREEIVAGFREVYAIVACAQGELLSAGGPIAVFANDEVRVLTLPTFVYGAMLLESGHPDVLRSGLDRDRFFDRLLAHRERYPYLARIEPAARRSLERGDVPLFTTKVDSRDLIADDGICIKDVFERAGMDLVRSRVADLCDADLERQVWLIEASLATLASGGHDDAPRALSVATPAATRTLCADALRDHANRIADRIAGLAVCEGEVASWLGLTMTRRGAWTLGPIGIDLFGGLSGVALALAYAGDRLGREDLTRLACGALTNLLAQIDRAPEGLRSIGAFTGLSGVVYALTHLGVLWQRDELIGHAQDLVSALPARIDADTELDVLGGAAGCALAVAVLQKSAPSASACDVLRKCGDHLIANARPQRSGRGWVSPVDALPLSGFSHGVAGIASALFEIASVTNDPRFAEAAREGIRYERTLFDARARNWVDLREHAGDRSRRADRFKVAWCHGAPGVGLGRARAWRHVDDEARAEIAASWRTTAEAGFGRNHSLCHGDFGNLEVLQNLRELADVPDADAVIAEKLGALVASLDQGPPVSGLPFGLETPGLMVGLAGTVFGLLRCLDPSLPSVLRMDGPATEKK